jgi:hypothetical protein
MDYYTKDAEIVIPDLDLHLPSGMKMPLPTAEKALRWFYDHARVEFAMMMLDLDGIEGMTVKKARP